MENTIALVQGTFSSVDAAKLLTGLVHTKMKFHEDHIGEGGLNEEDIHHSEQRIVALQDALREAVKLCESGRKVKLKAIVELEIL